MFCPLISKHVFVFVFHSAKQQTPILAVKGGIFHMYEMSVGLNRRLCSGLAWLFSRVPGHSDLPAVSMARLRSASCSRDDTNPVLNMFPFKEKVMLYPNLRQTRCHLKSNGWCSSFLGTRSKNWSGKTASSGDSVPWSYSEPEISGSFFLKDQEQAG